MIALYIDEDALDAGLVSALRSRGYDVLTAEEASMRGSSDEDHLAFATANGRVLFSYDRKDYFRLHTETLQQGRHHAGLIVLSRRIYDVGAQLRAIRAAESEREADGMDDWIAFA